MTPVKKILILSANPKNTERLRLDEEIREIKESLRLAKNRKQFEVKFELAVRYKDLRRALLDYEPQIVHFIGHGETNSVKLEDVQGNAAAVSSKVLSGLFELCKDGVETVIFSTCYSAAQVDAVNEHIHYVIGMLDKIPDEAAIKFSMGFYDALFADKTVEEAFEFGCNAVMQSFSDFPVHLIPTLKIKTDQEKKSAHILLKNKEDQNLLLDYNSLKNRIKQCSNASISRAEERIPKIEVNGQIKRLTPIPREDTSPDFEEFSQSDRSLMAVIGDSGSGKSTLLYSVATAESNKKFITLFYDVHHLQSAGSLAAKLIQDFGREREHLETVFESFDKTLSVDNKKLLIIIDGLNESAKIDPSELKSEIEDLGAKLPNSVKIIYSCRTVYWKTYINTTKTPISSALYHYSKEFQLHFYSERETGAAFAVYKNLYKFQGEYKPLNDELKNKIRDPLMLRMLAEGYMGHKLPQFAPAVKIFKNYEDSLKHKFKGEPFLVTFLYLLIACKLEQLEYTADISDQFSAMEIRSNDMFSDCFKMLAPGDPIILLEDEGILNILDADESVYRFTYDRFFEYLLGREMGRNFKISGKEDFVAVLIGRIQNLQRVHFSFIQALKSEIIRQNIYTPNGYWSFYDTDTLKSLLTHRDVAVVNFSKDILRELTFESERDTLSALEGVTDDALSCKFLALDIAGDSLKINPILIEGMFSGNIEFIRRCLQRISVIKDTPLRMSIEDSIVSAIAGSDLSENHAMGLVYYVAIIFYLEDCVGNDPFMYITAFWKRILSKVDNEINKFKTFIRAVLPKIVRLEAPLFFSSDTDEEGMDYFWTGMTRETKELALRMLPLVINPTELPNNEMQKILNFFGSEIKNWKDYDNPERSPIYTYRVEYRIAQWILIQRSVENYGEVKSILEGFVNTNFWLSMDFALCTMQYILETVYYNRIDIIRDGFSAMEQWVEKFMENDKFFDPFKRGEDPFSVTFNPLAQASEIDAMYLHSQQGPIKFLEEKIKSSDPLMARMALLAARQLYKLNPMKALSTFELIIDSEDDVLSEWLEKVLKEIYNFYPRLVEEFLERNKLPPERVRRIKFKTDFIDARGVEYSGAPLYKALFLISEDRRIAFAAWYGKLLKSPSIETFCGELSDYLFDRLQQEAGLV